MKKNEEALPSFELIYKTYFKRFTRFAETYVGQEDVAEDIVVDSFLSYWKNRENIYPKNIPAYILTTVKNRCLNYLKHLKVRYQAEAKLSEMQLWEMHIKIHTLSVTIPETLLSKELDSLIHEALQNMPKKTRKIFIMSRYDNRSHKEIAAELEISTKAVEYHIGRAIARLRIALQDYLPLMIFYFFYFLFRDTPSLIV